MPRKKAKKLVRTPLHLDEKYLGQEPIFKNEDDREEFKFRAYNWYNYFYSPWDLFSECINYATQNHLSLDLSQISEKYVKTYLSTSVPKLCRMSFQGFTLTSEEKEFIFRELSKLLETFEQTSKILEEDHEEHKEIVIKPKISYSSSTSSILSDLDSCEDTWIIGKIPEYNLYDKIYAEKPPEKILRQISNWISLRIFEFEMHSNDYSNLPRKHLSDILTFLKKLQTDLSSVEINSKNIKSSKRKTRKKKIKAPEKIFKNFKYCKESPQFKLISIDPQSLLSSNKCWTFNVKYRILSYYECTKDVIFDIKGLSLLNYDESLSYGIKIRKPEEFFKKFMKGSLKEKIDLVNSLTTQKIKPSGRFSSDVLLLGTSK